MRAHGQFVDGDILAFGAVESKEFDGQHAGHAEGLGDGQAQLGSALGKFRCKAGGGGNGLGADAVFLTGLGNRPHLGLAGRTAGDQDGKLAGKFHLFLCHQRGSGLEQLGDQLKAIIGGGEPYALAVITTAAGLEAHAAIDGVEKGAGIGHRVDGGKARHGSAQRGELFAHLELILRIDEGGGLGLDVKSGVDKRGGVLVGHMLMLEGNGIRALCHAAQLLQGGVIPQHHVRGDLRGGGIRLASQNPQVNIEFRGGRLHHAGQLAVATNSYNRL